MGTDSDYLALDDDSIQSEDINHVWYFELIIEHILIEFVINLLATMCTFHLSCLCLKWLESLEVCDPQSLSVWCPVSPDANLNRKMWVFFLHRVSAECLISNWRLFKTCTNKNTTICLHSQTHTISIWVYWIQDIPFIMLSVTQSVILSSVIHLLKFLINVHWILQISVNIRAENTKVK